MDAPDIATYPDNFWQRRRNGWFDQRYVLTSSDASRDEGVVSVLAVLETVFAVALYWVIAAVWDTHIHFVVSLFVAPLLLLRSPESMALGVEGFLGDQFGFAQWDEFSLRRKSAWLALFVVLGACTTYLPAAYIAQHWLVGYEGWPLFWRSALLGMMAVWAGTAVAVGEVGVVAGPRPLAVVVVVVAGGGVVAGAVAGAGMVAGTVAGEGMVAGAVAGVITTAVAAARAASRESTKAKVRAEAKRGIATAVANFGTKAVGKVARRILTRAMAVVAARTVAIAAARAAAIAVLMPGLGAGWSIRALPFRIVSTLRCLPQGFFRIPQNWRESTLVIDMRSNAELLPGIRHRMNFFSFDGLVAATKAEEEPLLSYLALPSLFAFFFLPALLYRLHIKATAWCYWLLVFLLWRQPQQEKEKAWLTSPWSAEIRRNALKFLVALGAVQLLVFVGLNGDVWSILGDQPAKVIRALWPQWLDTQAPWLGLVCLNAAACAWLLAWGNEFAHYFKEQADYQPVSVLRFAFGIASRLHTLCIALFVFCFVAAFSLHHYPDALHPMPAGQVDAFKRFLGLTA